MWVDTVPLLSCRWPCFSHCHLLLNWLLCSSEPRLKSSFKSSTVEEARKDSLIQFKAECFNPTEPQCWKLDAKCRGAITRDGLLIFCLSLYWGWQRQTPVSQRGRALAHTQLHTIKQEDEDMTHISFCSALRLNTLPAHHLYLMCVGVG